MSIFTPEEAERYSRHILLKEIGGAGQQRLKAAHVALIGAGGLGAPAALYLAAAGVGRLTLIDDDVVSVSNLQRQILYRGADLGAAKVERAQAALEALNPHVEIIAKNVRLNCENAASLLAEADVILDGVDQFAPRFAANEAAHALGRPLVSAAVGRWHGQISTFASGLTRGAPQSQKHPCYRCFVREAPHIEDTCAEGIVGALTGFMGSLMALEAVKIITRAGAPLIGRVLLFDGLSGESRMVALAADPDCPVCGHE